MTRHIMFRLFLVSVSMTLAACGTVQQTSRASHGPPKQTVADLSDGVFQDAVKMYLDACKGPQSSQYEYSREDLDGDGRREGIILLESPFYSWCTVDGCRMVIFKAEEKQFSVLSEISPVRGPLLLSDTRTNGWRDIVMRVSGRTGWAAKDVALKFNGATYPKQPAYVEPLPSQVAMANINGTQLFP